jgi:hypothetical protein
MALRQVLDRPLMGQVTQPLHAERLAPLEMMSLGIDDTPDEAHVEQLGELGLTLVQQA